MLLFIIEMTGEEERERERENINIICVSREKSQQEYFLSDGAVLVNTSLAIVRADTCAPMMNCRVLHVATCRGPQSCHHQARNINI